MRQHLTCILLTLIAIGCDVIEDSPSPEVSLSAPPLDVAKAPAEALVTESGLAYQVLKEGTGTEHPGLLDTVTVHYRGWTTDGEQFDSSIDRGEPSSFPLRGVIRGWTEGLQLMVVGEKSMFWIPEALAYKGQPGKPAGDLTFEIELISVDSKKSDLTATKEAEPPEFPAAAKSPSDQAVDLGGGVQVLTIKEARASREGYQPATPAASDKVDYRYNAWTQAGEFKSGVAKRGRPESQSLANLSTAWQKALSTMAEGQKVLIWSTAEASTTAESPVTEPMVYELELLRVRATLPAPSDVAAPPAEAVTTESGLSYIRLETGTGSTRPNTRSEVEVHYTGWTTDGDMFDSSVVRNKTSTFKAQAVIAGWTEGLQLMVEGDKYRFWIPEELAYQGKKGKPAGTLVFDVELVKVLSSPPPPPEAPPNASAPPSSAITLEEGVQYRVLKAGPAGGKKPGAEDWVQIHVIDWTQAGQYVGGTDETGEPISRKVEDFSRAWQLPLAGMVPGDKVQIWSSQEKSSVGRRKAEGDMVSVLELLAIGDAPDAPADVAAPPASAKRTESGLAYRVLKSGTGTSHPTATSQVSVHYSGWTTDGKLFDSSVARMEPAGFPLNRVIPGWTEGLQLMVVGETTRFWIPTELAYNGKPGRPEGMLVFDVELLEIESGK